ncbi:MAG TPA: hypothetical protein VLS85_09950 [Hanamia sp.]|nr:hypothetical protein [Hanamia sp.]
MEKDKFIPLPDKIVDITNSLQLNSILEIREKLLVLINELINKDFHALIQLLYRIDVNEKKIRFYLNEKPNEDAAGVLADLIIERQLQKIESRKKFSSGNNKDSDEEKW